MGNGYPSGPQDEEHYLSEAMRDISRQLRELQAQDGSQIYNTVQDLKKLIDGALNPTAITTPGNITSTAGNLVANSGIVRAPAVYSNILTNSYRVVYTSSTEGPGNFGTVPSSRQFKQEIEDADVDLAAVLAMRIVTYRYIEAVEKYGDEAAVEWGVIAEELHDLGLTWLVDYVDGEPFGVKKEQFIFAVIPVVQDHERRLRALEDAS